MTEFLPVKPIECRPGRQIIVCQNCYDFMMGDGHGAHLHECEGRCRDVNGAPASCMCVCGEAG